LRDDYPEKDKFPPVQYENPSRVGISYSHSGMYLVIPVAWPYNQLMAEWDFISVNTPDGVRDK